MVDAAGAEVDAAVLEVATATEDDAFDVPSTAANAFVSVAEAAGVVAMDEVTCG